MMRLAGLVPCRQDAGKSPARRRERQRRHVSAARSAGSKVIPVLFYHDEAGCDHLQAVIWTNMAGALGLRVSRRRPNPRHPGSHRAPRRAPRNSFWCQN